MGRAFRTRETRVLGGLLRHRRPVRPKIKAFWLENGDDRLLVLKADVIYSFDGLVSELTERLEEKLGEEMDGR